MTPFTVGFVASALAYLIGAIPFGYLLVLWLKGFDIRTVGSGNIGATNVGRTLGFRYFLLVFTFDMAKGLLPTLLFPRAAEALGLPTSHDMPVYIGLAAILGHNFPVYLKFKGGKGVATGLGVLFAWDAVAGLGALIGFIVFLGLTGFVSLSSILGGVCFVALHFMKTEAPFSREEFAMSVVTLGLLVLVTVRHRANIKRIAAGTEPKVKLGKKKKREGKIRAGLVLAIIAVLAAAGLGLNGLRRNEVTHGSFRLEEIARLATGHQRAERLAFLDGGRKVAVTCPRYGRVVLAKITDRLSLETVRDIKLEGRPVSIAESGGLLHVLQRPNGDARHLEEAWWDTFDLEGMPIGPRVRVGWDPDDMAIHPDGRHILILSSGDAEGETNRPCPALLVFERSETGAKPVARLDLNARGDDPARLALSADGKNAAVTIQGSRSLAWIDLTSPAEPRLLRRESLSGTATPEAVIFDQSGCVWIADPEGTALGRQESPDGPLVMTGKLGASADVADLPSGLGLMAVSAPKGSGVELLDRRTAKTLAHLPIRGSGNLAATRPLGLAVEPKRGLMAVANRAGGSVHLFRFTETAKPTGDLASAEVLGGK